MASRKSACVEKKTQLKVTSDHCKEAAPRWRTEICKLEDCQAEARWVAGSLLGELWTRNSHARRQLFERN